MFRTNSTSSSKSQSSNSSTKSTFNSTKTPNNKTLNKSINNRVNASPQNVKTVTTNLSSNFYQNNTISSPNSRKSSTSSYQTASSPNARNTRSMSPIGKKNDFNRLISTSPVPSSYIPLYSNVISPSNNSINEDISLDLDNAILDDYKRSIVTISPSKSFILH